MPDKGKKIAADLVALIMGEVRKHPEWNDIMDVEIIPRVQHAPHHPNWDAAFTMDGPRVALEGAFRIARELPARFDLA
jgi:hypothetical protein